MSIKQTVFAQVMDLLPLQKFRKCVKRYRGDYRVRKFSCLDQFLCMAFAQLTYRRSLRDIEACLRSMQPKLYHMGIRGRVSRSTLAEANERRDWRIYADFARELIAEAREMYAGDELGLQLAGTVYAFDATIIDLCLSLFPWAAYRKRKGGVKVHTLLDLRGNIPIDVIITAARVPEVLLLDRIYIEAGAIYILDRGYMDYARLYRIHRSGAFFVTRSRVDIPLRRSGSRPVDKATGLRCDQDVRCTSRLGRRAYPEALRRVRYRDPESEKGLVFLTNNFIIPAVTVAQLYKSRWQVELFFKWIKQHLRIKSFYGTSENAVKTQIWIAISTYVLVAILKKRLNIKQSLYTILQILSISQFEKIPILQALTENQVKSESGDHAKQLYLFDL